LKSSVVAGDFAAGEDGTGVSPAANSATDKNRQTVGDQLADWDRQRKEERFYVFSGTP
jgi:hypothetical protein